MYLFGDGLIKCLKCNSKFIGKKQRDKKVYICGTYNKLGKDACERFVIEEEYLIYAITKHIQLTNTAPPTKPLRTYIQQITVDANGYRIHYKDKSIAIFEQDRVKF